MKRTAITALLLALALGACAADDATTTTAADATTTTAAADTTTTEAAATGDGSLVLATSDLGDILTDSEGRTLYLFNPDAQGDSTCYDDCAEAWPAFAEEVAAGEGVDASLLGTPPGPTAPSR